MENTSGMLATQVDTSGVDVLDDNAQDVDVAAPLEVLAHADRYPNLSAYTDPVQQPARTIIGRDNELKEIMASLNRPELSNVILIAPPGSGKLLPLDTPIPTPSGWTTMGALQPGDEVFGQDGAPTAVTYVSEVDETPELYKLTFSDGSTQIACADHQWCVSSAAQRDVGTQQSVLTTQMMVDAGVMAGDRVNFAVRPAAALQTPDVVISGIDFAQVGMLLARGYMVVDRFYLRAGVEQRRCVYNSVVATAGRMLSQGDTLVEFPNSISADTFAELARTLGYLVVHERPTAVRVTQGLLHITAIEPVATQPGKCIQVDNADHMYLCGRGFVPTHNTALVQAAKMYDTERVYLELDLARMIANLSNENEMAARLKATFDEAERYAKDEAREIVIFMDEFHQVVQLSAAAVEALKPVLAASGTRGILVIAATTPEEYHKYIAPNQPLDERLQRIELAPTNNEMTVEILRGMAQRYGVMDQFYDNHLFERMVEWTNRYIPRSTQPRKAIRLLDAMIGWHRFTGEPMSEKLLAQMLRQQTGINVNFQIDGDSIKQRLDAHVFSQDLATSIVARRLQLVAADLNDKSRPMFSALFTGATGVGKTELTKQLGGILFGDDANRLIRFDMTEFALEESLPIFKSELTQKVADMGHAVILLDEIEKANPVITRLLLQILDDGRMRDDFGRQVSFLNTCIITTTNAGSEVYETIARYGTSDTGSGEELSEYMQVIRRSITSVNAGFPPELLGRLDAIVPFQPLSRNTQRKIVMGKMRQLRALVYKRHGVKVRIDPRVLTFITEDKVSTETAAGGARAAVRILNDEVATEIAVFLNRHPNIKNIQVAVQGTMRTEDKHLLKSTAKIVVSEALVDN